MHPPEPQERDGLQVKCEGGKTPHDQDTNALKHKATQTSFQQIKVAPCPPDTSPLLQNPALVTQPRGTPLHPPLDH